MDIPIEIFITGIGVSIALAIFGFIRNPQIPAMLVFGGMFMLVFAVATDFIIFNSVSDSVSTNTITDETIIYEEIASNSAVIHSATVVASGQWINTNSSILLGQQFNCMNVAVAKAGSPIGTITFGIMNNSTGTTVHEIFGTLDASLLFTGNDYYKFCILDLYEIKLNDIIGITHFNSSGVNTVRTLNVDSSVYDGANSNRGHYTTTTGLWTETGSSEKAMILSRGENTETTITSNVISTYEFTELPKMLFGLFGAVMMLCGAIMVGRN